MENLEPFIVTARTTISQINSASPGSLYQYEQHARAAVSYVDRGQLMFAPARLDEQIWVVDSLQRFTQATSATAGVQEVALWCEMQWNRILQYHAENLAALQGTYIHFTSTSPHFPTQTSTLTRSRPRNRLALQSPRAVSPNPGYGSLPFQW